MASRPLHFIFLCDCSGSMSVAGKIEALNAAIRESIPNMRTVAAENVHAQIWVRAIKFADTAEWHIGTPVKIEDFAWSDLAAEGLTAMGGALAMTAEELKVGVMPERGLPPVLVLITDGEPSDDFRNGLIKLLDQPWGRKAVRVAIAIGEDVRLSVLEEFVANPEIKPLVAHNADQLHRYIRWASTAVLKSASSPATETRAGAAASSHVPVPLPPVVEPLDSADMVW
jgi:uncharacterized protein YegL